MSNLQKETEECWKDIFTDNIIGRDEAFRLLLAIRFRISLSNEDKKIYWFDLLRQLVQLTKRDYLVPDHMKALDWESLSNAKPMSSS